MHRLLVIAESTKLPSLQIRFRELFDPDNSCCSCSIKSEVDMTTEDIDVAETIIFHKSFSLRATMLFLYAHESGKRTIYDIDDNILIIPDISVLSLRENQKETIKFFLRFSDAVSCTTERFSEALKNFNNNVTVVPNTMSRDRFRFRPDRADDIKNILISNSDYFKLSDSGGEFFGFLTMLFSEYEHLRLIYQGSMRGAEANPFFRDFSSRIEFTGFIDDYDAYLDFLSSANINMALVPLEETEFHSYKSCIKYLEFTANGIIAVFSKVKPYTDCIQDGENGILAQNTKTSWYEKTIEVIEKREQTRRILRNAFDHVGKTFENKAALNQWNRIFDNIKGLPAKKICMQKIFRVLYKEYDILDVDQKKLIAKHDSMIIHRDKVIKKQDAMIIERDELIKKLRP